MSEFEEAYILKCPDCGRRWCSCEGPLCDCYDRREEEKDRESESGPMFEY